MCAVSYTHLDVYKRQEFDCISPADWRSRCDHVMKIENDYVRSDQIMDTVTDRLEINIGRDSSSEDDLSDSDSDSNSDGNISGVEELT